MAKHSRVGVISLSKRWNFFIFLGLFAVMFVFHPSSASSKYDRENWVNPDDMLNYDRSTKTMKSKKPEEGLNNDHREPQETNADICSQCRPTEIASELQLQLTICENNLQNLKEPEYDGEKPCKRSKVEKMEAQYMRRFVNILLQVSGLADVQLDMGDVRQTGILIDVNGDHLVRLQEFASASSDVSLGELDDVLSEVLHSANVFNVPAGWINRLLMLFPNNVMHKVIPFALMLLVAVMLLLHRPMFEITVTALLLVFVLSYQHTYDYLLKKAEIDHYTTMKKYSDAPSFCRPPESWSDHLWSWFRSGTSECNKVHEAVMMDPSLRVPPTLVLAEMVSSMILHPAGKVGEGIARFSSGVLGGLPPVVNGIILAFCLVAGVVVMILVVLLCFGRGLRLWSLFGGVEITGQSRVGQQVRQAVQDIPSAPAPSTPLGVGTDVGSLSVNTVKPTTSAPSYSQEVIVVTNLPGHERLSIGQGVRSAVRELPSDTVSAKATASVQTQEKAIQIGGRVSTLEESSVKPYVDPLAGGDAGGRPGGALVPSQTATMMGDRTTDGSDTSADDFGLEVSARLETSEFIEEVRKILEEDLSFSEGSIRETVVVVPGSLSEVPPGPTSELNKRGSSDSSDSSEEFVKV